MEVIKNNTPKKTKIAKLTETEKNLSSAIMHAIELKSSFELYAHRVISPEQYIARTNELVQLYNKNVK